MRKIFIASDHAGYNLKSQIIKRYGNNLNIIDLGNKDSKKSVNYPDYAHKLCSKVVNNKSSIGILVCGSGMGMSMTANKYRKIRAALCYSVKNTKLSRLHNDANVITLGERLIDKNLAFKCINTFLNTKFEGGRHLKRVKKI